MRHLLVAFCLAAAAVSCAYAQGGDGRSNTVRLPASADDRRSSRQSRRSLDISRISTPKIPLPEMGRLAIKVSEGDSQLQIFRDGATIETINLPERSTSLIVRKLDVGSYTIAAKKPGFHDETRTVEIEKNRGRRVSIDLRPKMAILSVASNVPDAKISIDGLGDFDRRVEKAFVKPGKYRIKVSRRGYLSREMTVDLKTPGREERLNVIIEPLRVDAVLDLAFERIKANKLDEAEALANDVLALNPQHARGNLALGFVHLNRSETDKAVNCILQAIASGETFSLAVTVRVEPADLKTVSAKLRLDSRSLSFESSERPGLNFSIPDAGLERADLDTDSLVIAGRGDFHGRSISPRIQIYNDHLDAIRLVLSKWRK